MVNSSVFFWFMGFTSKLFHNKLPLSDSIKVLLSIFPY